MPQGDHHRTPTVSEAVRDAAALVDRGDSDDAITALYEIYEDDDRPVTAVEDLAGTLVATAEGIDPEGDDGALLATAAAAAWIGMHPHDRNEDHEADHVLREGARMAFGKEPPAQVTEYLSGRGIKL
ncbi:MAG TPA: hypothetical protein VHZ54_11730 [Solirubrobacterales bacterium]|jgi:hypothetical protein|nr:hypothetical protein [Solirubrobacterales bacterium]